MGQRIEVLAIANPIQDLRRALASANLDLQEMHFPACPRGLCLNDSDLEIRDDFVDSCLLLLITHSRLIRAVKTNGGFKVELCCPCPGEIEIGARRIRCDFHGTFENSLCLERSHACEKEYAQILKSVWAVGIVTKRASEIATPTTTSYTDTAVSVATPYSYTVSARDAAANESAQSVAASATIADTTGPSTPLGLGASVISDTQIDLTWSASTDNVGVTGYVVYRNGAQIATPTTTSYSDTAVSVATREVDKGKS